MNRLSYRRSPRPVKQVNAICYNNHRGLCHKGRRFGINALCWFLQTQVSSGCNLASIGSKKCIFFNSFSNVAFLIMENIGSHFKKVMRWVYIFFKSSICMEPCGKMFTDFSGAKPCHMSSPSYQEGTGVLQTFPWLSLSGEFITIQGRQSGDPLSGSVH